MVPPTKNSNVIYYNISEVSDMPLSLGLTERLILFFLPMMSSFLAEGMSRRVALFFSLTEIS